METDSRDHVKTAKTMDAPARIPEQPQRAAAKGLRAAAGAIWGATRSATSRVLAVVAAKGPGYWAVAAFVFALSFWVSPWLYDQEQLPFSAWNDQWFQILFAHGPRLAYVKRVRVVLIGDDEFHSEPLSDRTPIKRDYLAALVSQLASEKARANVIAIDFDLRTRDAQTKTIPKLYQEETCQLIDKIHEAVGLGTKVILATYLDIEKQAPAWDAYRAFGLCTPAGVPIHPIKCAPAFHTIFTDKEREMIRCGYVNLRTNHSEIPMPLTMGDGPPLDSFAFAIVRATDKGLTDTLLAKFRGRAPRAYFIKPEAFPRSHMISAGIVYRGELLRDPMDRMNLEAVIIGANWHGSGKGIDDHHTTPAGEMAGALINADYAEALFDDMTAISLPESVLTEIFFGIAAALFFAAYPGWWGLVALLPLVVVMFLFQVLALYAFGLYFDVLFPLLGLGIHSYGHNLFAHRRKAAH